MTLNLNETQIVVFTTAMCLINFLSWTQDTPNFGLDQLRIDGNASEVQ